MEVEKTMENEKEKVAVVIPINTKPVASNVLAGNLACGRPVGLEVRVESGARKAENEENIYLVDTIVHCGADEVGFHVSVAVQSRVFALGEEQTIYETMKNSVRDISFQMAEDMIFKLSAIHGTPVKIELMKHIQEQENNEQ